MQHAFKQVNRATGEIISIIWYNFSDIKNNHPDFLLVPIRTPEEYAEALAELEVVADEENTDEDGQEDE